jgi:ABC-2 type transport system permease protein
MWWIVFQHEGRVLLADRTLLLVSALFLSLVGYGLYHGVTETARRDDLLEGVARAQREGEAARRVQLRNIMEGRERPQPFANPTDPSSMGGAFGARHAIMPSTPLAPLALGQSELLSNDIAVTVYSKITFMYDSEIENPWHLLNGDFDLAYVVIYLSPLLIFALGYNFLSGDREQGTLKLLLSQPLGLPGVVAGKIAVRMAAVLACTVVIPCAAIVAFRPEVRSIAQLPLLLSWAGFVAIYSLFWFALVTAVNAFGRASATNALLLVGTWVVLVLVVPVVMNLAVSIASPAPSRAELATRTRLVTSESLNRYSELFGSDYEHIDKPELLLPKDGKIEVAPRMQAFYLADQHVDENLEALLERFRAQLAGQQRLIARFGMLSPAIVAYEGMTALAGTGLRRHVHFQNQVDSFHRSWKAFFEPRILKGIAITESDLDRLPGFAWREEEPSVVRAGIVSGLLQLTVPAVAFAVLGIWRLRRYAIV